MRPKRTAAEQGTANLTHLYQSTIGVAADGTLRAHLPQSSFQPSEASAPLEDFAFGSIMRIRLKNFQKYSECTIRPGPHMNMVLGPNGTGKSTIVAAIALGLGFGTSVLGRSNDTKEFIRHGQDKAFIELVMRTGSDPQRTLDEEDADLDEQALMQTVYSRPFVTLKRVISNVNGKAQTEWFFNESPTSIRVIQQVARLLRAQVDNMCQFLPQDKVGDFVKMNSMERLAATQEAAALPGTLEKHKQLIAMRVRDRELEAILERGRSQMRQDQIQVSALEERKNAAQEARKRSERLQQLRQKRPWLKYKKLREIYIQKRAARQEAKERLDRETLELNSDLQTQQTNLERQHRDLMKAKTALEKQKARLRASLERDTTAQQKRSQQIEALKAEIVNKRASRVRNRQNAESCREELRGLDQFLRDKQSELDRLDAADGNGDHETQLKEATLRLREAQYEKDQLSVAVDAMREEGSRLQEIIQEATRQVQKLDSQHEQKLDSLRRCNLDAARALEWLETDGNRSKMFRGQVIGPLCMEIGVKAATHKNCPEMTRMVESCISRQILASFVVTDPADHEVFMRECCDERRMRVNCILLPNLATLRHQSPWSRAELAEVGFAGVLVDVLEGSPLALQALCEVAFIHKIPYCLAAADEKLDMRACEANANLFKFVARDAFFELRRSRYAPGEVANRCSPLKNEMYLSRAASGQSNTQRQQLAQKMSQARQRQSQLEREMHAKLSKAGDLDATIDALRKYQQNLNDSKRTRLSILALMSSKRESRDTLKKRLRQLVQKSAELDESEEQEQLRELLVAQAEGMRALVSLQTDLHALLMQAVELTVNEQCLSIQLSHTQQLIQRNAVQNEALRIALEQAENEMVLAKAAAEEALLEHQNNNTGDMDESIFAQLPDDLDQIDDEIAETEAYLQARGHRGNQFTDAAEQEYASRLQSLHNIAESVTLAEAQQAELRGQIRELAQAWRAAIDDVIVRVNARFGELFSRINCAGCVELGIPPNSLDFDLYELAIKVAFRTGETPQLLSLKQSGGERSVSTMLYLLSFQNLARAPLRVVDEINQGMDEDYERHVYSLIVETATRATNSQYFLISPKLLKGLEYSERMRILFVYNGIGVPESLGH